MPRPVIGVLLLALALVGAHRPSHASPSDWTIVELVSPGETLGWQVSLDGDTVAVANSGDDAIASNAGAVWVFQRDQGGPGAWGLVKKITAPGAAYADFFGSQVALRGDTLVASARYDDDDGEDSGSVFVFERDQGGSDNWGLVKRISSSDAGPDCQFGYKLDFDGETLAVTAQDGSDNESSVYLFEPDAGGPDNWGEVKRIRESDLEVTDLNKSAIDGDTLVIDPAVASPQRMFVLRRDEGGPGNWGKVAEILEPSDE